MPELTAVIERPQPKPRLSLLLTSLENRDFDDPRESQQHVYQNFGTSCLDEGLTNGRPSSSAYRKASAAPKPKPRRRSLLDLPSLKGLSEFEIGTAKAVIPVPVYDDDVIRRNYDVGFRKSKDCCEDYNWNRSLSNLSCGISERCRLNLNLAKTSGNVIDNENNNNNNKVFETFIDGGYVNESNKLVPERDNLFDVDGFQPIRCMPYNSPRLNKAPRGAGLGINSKMLGLTKSSTDLKPSKCTVNNGTIDNSVSKRPSSTMTTSQIRNSVPVRSERGAVSTQSQLRKPAYRKLEEVSSLTDKDSSGNCNTVSLSASTGSRRIRSTSASSMSTNTVAEKRKSAAVPPQMVANLTSKFNALSSDNHDVKCASTNAGVSSTTDLIGRRKVSTQIVGGSMLPTLQSCPSSPMRNAPTVRIGGAVKGPAKDTNTNPASVKVVLKGNKMPSIPGSHVESAKKVPNEGKEVRLAKVSQGGSRSSSPKRSTSPGLARRKNFVQQAVLNYEVTISSTSSSPEISRRNSLPKRYQNSVCDSGRREALFASPVLLKRRLLSVAEAKASKFTTAESNHESVGNRTKSNTIDDTIGQNNERTAINHLKELTRTGTESLTVRSSELRSNSNTTTVTTTAVKSMLWSTQLASDKISGKLTTAKQPTFVTWINNDINSGSGKSFHSSVETVTSSSSSDSVGSNPCGKSDEGKNGGTSALAKGRELFEKRFRSTRSEVVSLKENVWNGLSVKRPSSVPPPLPTTQPRVVHKPGLVKRNVNNGRDVTGKTTPLIRDDKIEKTVLVPATKCHPLTEPKSGGGFLHSKVVVQNCDNLMVKPANRFDENAANHCGDVNGREKKLETVPVKSCGGVVGGYNFKASFLHSVLNDGGEAKSELEVNGSAVMINDAKTIADKCNYAPNSSFLWRDVKRPSRATAMLPAIPPPPTSAPPPIPEQDSMEGVNNIYDDVISPCSDEWYDEPLYSEAIHSPLSGRKLESGNEFKDDFSKKEVTANNDSDEGWVDVSDTEADGQNPTSAFLKNNVRMKSPSRRHSTKKNKLTRRSSWCQSTRDLSNVIDNGKTEENEKIVADSIADSEDWPDFDDFSDSGESNSTNPDHHYEALYELDAQCLAGHGGKSLPDHGIRSREGLLTGKSSSTVILEESTEELCEGRDPVYGGGSRSVMTVNLTNAANVAKAAETKPKQLKRNWSLTKSDIRLELTSRLNRIRVKKTSTSASDVHSKSTVEAAAATFGDVKKSKPWSLKTRFTRNRSTDALTSPTKKSPSPKKESALFYVTSSEMAATTTTVTTKTAESVDGDSPRSVGSPSKGRGSRRISGNNMVMRPREAPPAPPVSRFEMKPRNGSISSVESGWTKASSVVSGDTEVQENDNYSSFSAVDANSLRHDSDTDSIRSGATRYTDHDPRFRGVSNVSRSNSTVSSENEVTVFLPTSPKTRTSIASSESSSSNENYNQMENVEPSLLEQMSELFKEAAKRQSLRSVTSLSSTSSESAAGNYLREKVHPFDDEPLYQFYNIAAQKRATQMNLFEGSDDDYGIVTQQEMKPSLKSKLSAMDLLTPSESGQRTLWGELPEVRNSGILASITQQQRVLQEAMFEVITSEASYFKSLNVLVNHFMNCQHFLEECEMCVLTKRERHVLFSDVLPVKKASERFLADLEKRWQENIMMTDICDILFDHANNNFSVFVKYCSNQVYQDRTLKALKDKSPAFMEVLKKLESSPACQSLEMHSFLLLPMQRITRLPLLIDNIFHRLEDGTKQYEICKLALQKINSIVKECNEGARKMARMEEMVYIQQSLNFQDIRALPLISSSRWLVKRGELQKLSVQNVSSKLGLVRRNPKPKQTISLFLFTDHLVLTKKKAEDSYRVLDHCPRNMVQVFEMADSDHSWSAGLPDGCKNLLKLTMLQNHENKTVELIFCCPSESDRARWMEAVTPKLSENPDETIYEVWDCPQVQVLHSYDAQQSDELTLEQSDVINVLKKVADGWYLGERIRDGTQGWFPANHTEEIVSAHVRARNLRQRYRFLLGLEEQRLKENL